MDSAQLTAILLAAVWLVGGFVVAVFMKRAGRDFRLWLLLGLLLGPFAGFFAPNSREARDRHPAAREASRAGSLDIIAGIDGSEESVSAVRAAVALLGGNISSLTLARVLAYEAAESYSGRAARAEAAEELSRVSSEIEFHPVEIEILYGPPAHSLTEFASDQGMELIVIGARGRGMTKALFGSVALDLVSRSTIPVLVGPGKRRLETSHTSSSSRPDHLAAPQGREPSDHS